MNISLDNLNLCFTVADVEVKDDGVFIRLWKELVSSGSNSVEGCVKVSTNEFACVKEVAACEEDAMFDKDNFDCTTLQAGEFVSLESVDNIPMEELLNSDCGKRSSEDFEKSCSVSLDTVLDVNISC
jgi:hypothetical protein